MFKISVVLCLLGICSTSVAQISIEVADGQGNVVTDNAKLLETSVAYVKEKREKYSKAKTIADAIEIAVSELKAKEMPQFASLLTEKQVLRSTKNSLYRQLHQIVERKKIQPNSVEAAKLRYRFEQEGPIATFAALEKNKIPNGGYFDYQYAADPDGTIAYFRLYLSAKPDRADPDFQYTATIFEVNYGTNP